MKILNFILFFYLLHFVAYCQCNVDAGEDIFICVDKFGVLDSTNFKAEIIEGTSPYTIKWEAEKITGLQSIPVLTASDYLLDTTILQGLVINDDFLENNEPFQFKLTVEDSAGKICSDSVQITYSKFALLPEFLEREIDQGDTLEINAIVGNGIPPLSYLWSPNYNIDNTSNSNPHVWPDTTTIYDVIVTDAVGCVSSWGGTAWTVFVRPVSVASISGNSHLDIYPNPSSDLLTISFPTSTEAGTYSIFSLDGRLKMQGVLDLPINNSINISQLDPGIHIIKVQSGKEVYVEKIVVK